MFSLQTIQKLKAYSAALDARNFLKVADDSFSGTPDAEDTQLFHTLETAFNTAVTKFTEVVSTIEHEGVLLCVDSLGTFYLIQLENENYLFVSTVSSDSLGPSNALFSIKRDGTIVEEFNYIAGAKECLASKVAKVIDEHSAAFSGKSNNAADTADIHNIIDMFINQNRDNLINGCISLSDTEHLFDLLRDALRQNDPV